MLQILSKFKKYIKNSHIYSTFAALELNSKS